MLKQSPWRGSRSLKGGVETVSMATCSAQIERAPGYTTTPCHGTFTCFPRSYTPALLLLLEPQQDHRCFPELSVFLKQNRKWLLQIPMGKCHTGLPTRHRTFHLNAECPPVRGWLLDSMRLYLPPKNWIWSGGGRGLVRVGTPLLEEQVPFLGKLVSQQIVMKKG